MRRSVAGEVFHTCTYFVYSVATTMLRAADGKYLLSYGSRSYWRPQCSAVLGPDRRGSGAVPVFQQIVEPVDIERSGAKRCVFWQSTSPFTYVVIRQKRGETLLRLLRYQQRDALIIIGRQELLITSGVVRMCERGRATESRKRSFFVNKRLNFDVLEENKIVKRQKI